MRSWYIGSLKVLALDVGHPLDQDLVELALENVFAHAAVKKGRLVERGPHLLEQLAEERLADEIGEGFFQLGRVVTAAMSGSRGLGAVGQVLAGLRYGRTFQHRVLQLSAWMVMSALRLFDDQLAEQGPLVLEHFDDVDHVGRRAL